MANDELDKLIRQSLLIEAQETKDAGAVGFMARALTQATMPHRKTSDPVFSRKNGALSLTILAHPDVGLPYGSIPRLLLSWITTEAVRTKSPHLELGPSLSAFMEILDITPTGGRWGTITRLKEQIERLFSCMVSCRYCDESEGVVSGAGFVIAKEYRLWWNPKSPDQIPLWKSTVTLSTDFFEEIIKKPIPVDMRALKALRRSPMALDIYCWLTYRLSYLRKKTEIPWGALQMQFGADYTRDGHGLRNFKMKFLHHLRAVHVIYPQANVEEGEQGLLLKPSKPHVAQLPPALPRLKNPPIPEPLLLPLPDFQGREGPFLRTHTYEMARKAAPGWDVYELERQWREWIEKKGPPKKPDAAFIAFCRKKTMRMP
jgi:hypothetical protein